SLTLPPQSPLIPGWIEKIAVSPDGGRVAYIADGDPPSLYAYSLGEMSCKPIPQTENAHSPFFSPDGRWVAFTTPDGLLKKVSLDGGAPVVIGKTGDIRGASWGENDQIVFGSRWSPLKAIPASGGTVTVLSQQMPPGFDARWPSYLPGAKRVLFTQF